jgi:hypothetical protein
MELVDLQVIILNLGLYRLIKFIIELQSHVSLNIPNTVEAVDLLRLAKIEKTKNKGAGEQFKLVIDGECCLGM